MKVKGKSIRNIDFPLMIQKFFWFAINFSILFIFINELGNTNKVMSSAEVMEERIRTRVKYLVDFEKETVFKTDSELLERVEKTDRGTEKEVRRLSRLWRVKKCSTDIISSGLLGQEGGPKRFSMRYELMRRARA